jgi:hypothetical protein
LGKSEYIYVKAQLRLLSFDLRKSNLTMTENRISIELTTEVVAEVKALIDQIEGKLPFLVGLTTDERNNYPKLSRENELFVEETVRAADHNKAVLPPYIDTTEMEKDLALFQQLSRVMVRLSHVHAKIKDTMHIAGAEALATALVTNNMFQIAAKMGVEGMDVVSARLAEVFSAEDNDQ